MSESSIADLVSNADSESFHQAVRSQVEEDGDFPSLALATFSELELVGFDFSEMDLSNAEFSDCTLTGVDFDECNLEGTFFQGCTFFNCSFNDIEGGGPAIDASTLSRCEIKQSSFDFPEWTDSQFNDCEIEDLTGENYVIERTTVKGGHWHNFRPSSGQLKFVTLRSMTLDDVDLNEVDVKNCYYIDIELEGTELPDTFGKKTERRKMGTE
jgi:uncharacterized protein YjbI with pentapeptide repeats